jgi:hypothetical protein
MSLLEQQNFLAKLYTDEKSRRAFASEPFKIGRENDLSDGEVREISEVFHEEITFFAESLFWKRLRETEKLLPLTKKVLDGDFESLFRNFSQIYKPQSLKKHLEDAAGFCLFLRKTGSVSEIGKDCAKYEAAKLRFYGYGDRFTFCRLKFDVEQISRRDAKGQRFDSKKKTKFAVWIRFGERAKHYFF